TVGNPQTGRVPIPGHLTALSFLSKTDEDVQIHSVTPHGPYVLFQYVRSKNGVDAMVGLVAKTLDLQEPLIDRFVADDPARFADLVTDDTGLLSRTLPLTSPDPDLPPAWVFQPRAALHFQDDPATTAPLFAQTGVVAVSIGKSKVYEAADPLAAQQLADQLAAQQQNGGYRAPAPVPGVPTARCFDGGRNGDASPRRFYCDATADRYAYEIYSNDELDAHRQVAAQYRLLIATDRRW
ncbi:MAG TPA: hypothetical protein VMU34_01760, partial [Mycobacterium sp.]|nr:hypothetical protein [Mycobacterium sp.]